MAKKSTSSRRSSKVSEAKFALAEATTEPRRILYIITKSVWGGAARYVFDLATHLTGEFKIAVAAGPAPEPPKQNKFATGQEARYGINGQGRFAQEIKQANIPYYQIKNFQRPINPFKDFFAVFEILGIISRLRPDIIHVNSSKAGGLVGLASSIYKLKNKNYKLKTIFTAHGWAFNEDRSKWQIFLITILSKLTAIFYDQIICVSQYDRQTAIKNKITSANKLVTIHNGIDIKAISFLSRSEAQEKLLGKTPPADGLVIGTIAEWAKNKGLVYLLKAGDSVSHKLVGDRVSHIDFILIGSGENPDKEQMYAFVKKHQLKNIHLIEWIDQAASYLKAFDIFVLPSVKEGLPYTILEAMAGQVSIIASKVGGVPEMINDPSTSSGQATGLLIPLKNSQQLAEKIIYLVNNPIIAQKMAQKAKEKVVKEFGLEKMLQETRKLYIH